MARSRTKSILASFRPFIPPGAAMMIAVTTAATRNAVTIAIMNIEETTTGARNYESKFVGGFERRP